MKYRIIRFKRVLNLLLMHANHNATSKLLLSLSLFLPPYHFILSDSLIIFFLLSHKHVHGIWRL